MVNNSVPLNKDALQLPSSNVLCVLWRVVYRTGTISGVTSLFLSRSLTHTHSLSRSHTHARAQTDVQVTERTDCSRQTVTVSGVASKQSLISYFKIPFQKNKKYTTSQTFQINAELYYYTLKVGHSSLLQI